MIRTFPCSGAVRVGWTVRLVAQVVEQEGGHVALTEVGDDRDNQLAFVLRLLCFFEGSPDVGAGGDADQDAFLGREFAGVLDGVLDSRVVDVVKDILVEVVREEVGADALDLVRAEGPLGEQGESLGSTPTTRTFSFCSLRYFPAPEIVPPVPTPAMKTSTLPSVSSQISGPVVL